MLGDEKLWETGDRSCATEYRGRETRKRDVRLETADWRHGTET